MRPVERGGWYGKMRRDGAIRRFPGHPLLKGSRGSLELLGSEECGGSTQLPVALTCLPLSSGPVDLVTREVGGESSEQS